MSKVQPDRGRPLLEFNNRILSGILENFEAVVALNFASHNFVKSHRSLKLTPEVAASVERNFWSCGDLLEAAL